jgi:small-conductance mechanosensitive channel
MKATVAACRVRGPIAQCLCGLVALAAILTAMPAGVSAAETQASQQIAPVKLANRTIIELHGPVAGFTAERRAQDTMERIDQALDSEMYPQITLEEMKDTGATRVLMGGKYVFLVTKLDIDESAGETTLAVADEARKRLEQAIRERREQQTPRYLAIAAAYAAIATLFFGVVLWFLLRGSRWIRSRLADAAVAKSEKLQFGGVGLLDSGRVLVFTQRVTTLLTWVIGIVLTIAWLTFVLRRFPYTRPWGDDLRSNLADLLGQAFTAIVESIPGLVLLLVIIVVARTVIRTFAVFFDRAQQGKAQVRWIDAETAGPTRYIFNFLVCAFALAIAYPYLPGADTEAFKGISVLLGIMVSIGGASVIGQAFSGLILMYMRAFRRGDYVRVGDTEGTVVDLGIFATRIRTGLGEEVTVPNSEIMSAATKNYSRAESGTGYVVDTNVTIGYATPWRQVQAMLLEAAKRTSEIAPTPLPYVRQTALSDFYVQYRLVAYTPVESPALRIDVLSRLHENIQDVFNEYGVQIMSPNYEADPPAPQVVPKEQWYAAPARPPETWRANERLLEQS